MPDRETGKFPFRHSVFKGSFVLVNRPLIIIWEMNMVLWDSITCFAVLYDERVFAVLWDNPQIERIVNAVRTINLNRLVSF